MERLADPVRHPAHPGAVLGAVLLAAAALLAAPAAAAPPPTPSWSATLTSYPSFFAHKSAGGPLMPPGYLLVATNVGAAPTSGEFRVTSTLPAGLSFAISEGAFGRYGPQSSGNPLTCEAAGQTVTCLGSEPTLKPGESVRVDIPVKVAAGSFHSVRTEATVEGGGAIPALAVTETPVGPGYPAFDFLPGEAGLNGSISGPDGSPATQAGSHPYQATFGVNLPTRFADGELLAVGGGVKDLTVDMPGGLVVNPAAVTARCTEAELENGACPDSSQVGSVALSLEIPGSPPAAPTIALYEMVPPPGSPVEFALEPIEGNFVHLLGRLRSGGDYGLSADIADLFAQIPFMGARITLWGNPSDESHDYVRGACLHFGGVCPVERTNEAFLTLPSDCGGPLVAAARADSWLEPGAFVERQLELPPIDGCNALEFEPSVGVQPTTNRADSPTGLDVSIHLPQRRGFDELGSAPLRDTTISLPPGLVLNPAGADGLGSCRADQVGSGCPNDSKLGTAEISTPLADHPLRGAIYLARPYENPSGSFLAVYVVIEDPTSGIHARLDGRLEADPGSGRLTVFLSEAPQLPIEDVKLHFFDQARSFLASPVGCGEYQTTSRLTPWSAPEGSIREPADSFRIDAAAGGGVPCPRSEAAAPLRTTLSAGAVAPRAGSYQPFVLQLARADGTQRLGAVEATLPAGLSTKIAGVPSCEEVAIAAGSCPADTRVGSVDIGAGAGPLPLRIQGGVYLAGPSGGAPISLAVLVPAVVGPFDLGTVAIRIALHVDSRTAQIRAVSGPLPTILNGIPLDVRSIAVSLDRPGFIRTPTSCDSKAVAATVTSTLGDRAELADRFQVGGCDHLHFTPNVSLRLGGSTRRGAHPTLRAVMRTHPGDGNPRSIAVTLPRSQLLDFRHIRGVCTGAEFAEGNCPPSSEVAWAKVRTPLLDRPLEGPVYLQTSGSRLPDLAISLRGQIQLDLLARISSVDGRLRVSLGGLPDAPITSFSLAMKGGRQGLLVNSGGLCRGGRRAKVSLSAQNGRSRTLHPLARTTCGG